MRRITAAAAAVVAGMLVACTSAPSRGQTAAAEDPGPADPAQAAVPQGDADAPWLRGLDHVVIGVNDVEGAALAYGRLGFTVLPFGPSLNGGPTRLVDLGNGYLAFTAGPPDSAGSPSPYTFEGAIAQGWEVDLRAAESALDERGVQVSQPIDGAFAAGSGAAGAPPWRQAVPENQPVSGTALLFVDYGPAEARADGGAEAAAVEFERLLGSAGIEDALDHPNGSHELAYVTVAVSRLENPVQILESWGLEPRPPVEDVRGGRTVEVPLGQGSLYLTAPTGGGGVQDFLEERRAMAAPVGERFYEGSILAIGIGVHDLAVTEEFLKARSVLYFQMELPSGPTLVVQAAPGWGLRLEFVEREGAGSGRSWAAHRGARATPKEGAP